MQDVDDEVGGRADVQGEAAEGGADGRRQQQELAVAQHFPVIDGDVAQVEGVALLLRQAFRQRAPDDDEHQHAEGREEPENPAPAQAHLQPAAQHGRDGRRQREHHHDVRKDFLRGGARIAVLHDGAADHGTGARRQPLQHAPGQQPAQRRRQRGAHGGDHIQHQRDENHGTAAERIGQGAVKQHHEGEREQEKAQRLLHQQGAGIEILHDGGERRQIGVNCKRSDHRQARQNPG